MGNVKLCVDNRFDLLDEGLNLGDIRLDIFLCPVQEVILVSGVAHILKPGQQGSVFIGEDAGADIVLPDHTDSPFVGLG